MPSDEHGRRTSRGMAIIQPYFWLFGLWIMAAVALLILSTYRALNGDYSGYIGIAAMFGVTVVPYILGKRAFIFLHNWSAKQLAGEYND